MTSIGLRFIGLVRRIAFRMFSTNSSYEDAIQQLNSLQSNKSTIEQIKRNLKSGQQKCTNLEDMANYLQRVGIPLTKLDELSVIHVAGTKGKGSTSAMCESILRRHGFRTGFYSSPHLVAARERVRLDGCPLTKDTFATHFHRVYGLLWDSQEYEGDMPKYFAFLTVMAFHVFLQERVDVAIIEVGIGGIVDYTNVLRKVPVVGITALGLDHTSILGDTLPMIAAAKAGIMKRGCDAYTVRQPREALDVLTAFADHVKCPLSVVPDYTSYTFPKSEKSHLAVDLDAYKTNASLAIQLSHAWMRITQAKTTQNGFSNLMNKGQNGLNNSANKSPNAIDIGQNTFTNGNIKKTTNGLPNGNTNMDILINSNKNMVTLSNGNSNMDALTNGNSNMDSFMNGNSNMDTLTNGNKFGNLVYKVPYETMEGLRHCKWPGRYHVVEAEYTKFYLDGAHTKESMEICVNWFSNSSNSSANKTLIFSATGDRNAEILLQPLISIPFKQVYFVIPTAHKVTSKNHDNFSLVEQEELMQRCQKHALIWQKSNSGTNVTVLGCVADALISIKKQKEPSVLITGSLHLVGAALSILDPNLTS